MGYWSLRSKDSVLRSTVGFIRLTSALIRPIGRQIWGIVGLVRTIGCLFSAVCDLFRVIICLVRTIDCMLSIFLA